jgi:uncharacterized protein YukE
MALISAEEGALRRGADAVRDARSGIADRKRQVADEVLAASYWKGKAADDFKALMQNWDSKAEGLLKTLDGLETALRGSESDQVAQEDEVSSSVGNLAAGMSGI